MTQLTRSLLTLAILPLQAFKPDWPNLTEVLARPETHVDEHLCESLLYRAPELLRSNEGFSAFTQMYLQKADIYRYVKFIKICFVLGISSVPLQFCHNSI